MNNNNNGFTLNQLLRCNCHKYILVSAYGCFESKVKVTSCKQTYSFLPYM